MNIGETDSEAKQNSHSSLAQQSYALYSFMVLKSFENDYALNFLANMLMNVSSGLNLKI